MRDDAGLDIQAIVQRALALDGDEREDFLARECRDPALRRQVDVALLNELRTVTGIPAASPTRRGPERIGPYRILGRLGEGGMGEVYLAQQEEPIRRRVAVKIIKRGLDSREVVARFESERQALALMDHPNIARVLEAGATEDGLPYFVMEYVQGSPITAFCDRAKLSMRERLELFLAVCDGVQHAHQKAILHRDLKPSNILVTLTDDAPTPKIIDFGIAKALEQKLTDKTLYTELGRTIGTPEYMSPEQAELSAEGIDTRTDVYTLGVVLYELLTGVLPFEIEETQRRNQRGIVGLHQRDPQRPSHRVSSLGDRTSRTAERRQTSVHKLPGLLRGDLDWITLRALEKERARRYPSPSELAADIRRHLRDEPVLAGPPSAKYRFSKFVRRHRVGVSFAVAIALLLIGFAATMTVQARRIARERDRANQSAELARREAETARRTSDFLADLFGESDPSRTQGEEPTARDILDRGAERLRGDLRDQPEIQAPLMTTIGRVYARMGIFDTAIPLLEEAVAAAETTEDQRPLDLATSLIELGNGLDLAGDSERAEPILRRALEIRQRELPPTDPGVARALHRLGVVVWHNGEMPEAEGYIRQAIEIYEENFGRENETITRALHNLAALRHLQGDLKEAEKLYLETMRLEERFKGPNDFELATTMHTLAIVYQSWGDYEKAESLEQRSLAIRENVLGPDHPHVALSLTTLGQIYQATGRAHLAPALLQRAVEIGEAKWGPAHGDVNWARRSLARACIETGAYTRAESLMQRSIQIEEAKGELAVSLDIRELGRAELALGRPRDAEATFRRAVRIGIEAEGKDDTWAALGRANLANLLRDEGRHAEAETEYREALRVMQSQWGPEDVDSIATLADYVELLRSMGRDQEADRFAAEVDSLRQS